MIINILFLPILFFIGLVTSWEDFRFGKIRNKWIILGLVFAVVILTVLFFWNFIAEPVTLFYYAQTQNLTGEDQRPVFTVNSDYFGRVIINSFIALLLGYFLWRKGLLAAGDAKLFFVFSLLLPLKYYWKSYLFYFPSFALFINIFLPVLLFIFIKAVWHLFNSSKEIKKLVSNLEIPSFPLVLKVIGQAIKILIGFIGVFILVGKLRNFVVPWIMPYLSNEGFIFLILIFIYRRFLKIIMKSNKIFIAIVLFLIVFLVYGFIYNQQETTKELLGVVKMVIVFLLGLRLLRVLLNYYIKNSALKKIKPDELKPGMSLVSNKDNKKEGVKRPKLGTIFGGGLSKKQVNLIKKWAVKNKLEYVEVYQRFPFAFWMFLGVIITILIKGSLTMFLPFFK